MVGRSCRALQNDPTIMTAKEFFRKIGANFDDPKFNALFPTYVPPYIPSPCEKCHQECTSECGACGEVYCSRACFAKDWSNHRQICATVWENSGSMPSKLTMLEMRSKLSEAQMDRAFGYTTIPHKCSNKDCKNSAMLFSMSTTYLLLKRMPKEGLAPPQNVMSTLSWITTLEIVTVWSLQFCMMLVYLFIIPNKIRFTNLGSEMLL